MSSQLASPGARAGLRVALKPAAMPWGNRSLWRDADGNLGKLFPPLSPQNRRHLAGLAPSRPHRAGE